MDGGDVDTRILHGFLLDLRNHRRGLRHVVRTTDLHRGRTIVLKPRPSLSTVSTHLDVASSHNDSVHLLQGQLGGFSCLILYKGVPLVFHRCTVPGHVDSLDGAERSERLSNRLLPQFKVDAAYVNPVRRSRFVDKGLLFVSG